MKNLFCEYIALIISACALFISYKSWRENRKNRIEVGRAFISMSLMQIDGKLFVMLQNIGKTYAYDVKITTSIDFVNGFETLSVIQPGIAYGYLLMDTVNVSQYPDKIQFDVKYHDYYSSKKYVNKNFALNILDTIKYDMYFNKTFNYYEIKKTF